MGIYHSLVHNENINILRTLHQTYKRLNWWWIEVCINEVAMHLQSLAERVSPKARRVN